jgi:SpoVK/Ycf46/Vps4 family AAA+-type ATPase
MLEWPHRREIQSKVEEGLRKCKVVLLYGDARTGKSTLAQDIMKDGETYKKISPLEFENVGIVGAADDAFDHAVKNVSHLLIDDLDMLMSPALVWKLCDLVDRVRNGAQYTVILGVSSRAHAIHEKLLRANRFDYWVEMGSLDFIDRRGIVDVLLPMRIFCKFVIRSKVI